MDIPESDIQLMEKYASDPYKFMVTKLFDVKKTKTDDIITDFNDTNKILELEFSKNGSQLEALYTSLGWIDIKVLPTNETTISMNNSSKSHDNRQLNLATNIFFSRRYKTQGEGRINRQQYTRTSSSVE